MPPSNQSAKDAYFTASQGQLIWTRFKKQKAAMVGAWVLVILILSGIFAPFLTPYDPTIAGRDKDYLNGAPTIPQFCDDNGCSIRPFIYAVERERSMPDQFRWVTTVNTDKRQYVQFFVEGSEIQVFGSSPLIRICLESRRGISTCSAPIQRARTSSRGPSTPSTRRWRSAPSACSSPLCWR